MAWNRPKERDLGSGIRDQGAGKSPFRGLVAGAIVVVGAAVAAWWLWPETKRGEDAASTKKGLIKEVKPSVPTNALAVAEAPVDPNADPPGTYRDANGVLRKPGGMRVKDPKRQHIKVTPPAWLMKEPVFRNLADREIASIISLEPGERVYGSRMRYDAKFKQQFVEALLSGDQINKDDPERIKALKKEVYETKKELAARVRAGEDLGEILETARKEQLSLANYRDNVLRNLNEMTKGGNLTDEEVSDYVQAANKMLSSKGMKQLKEKSFLIRNMKLRMNANKSEKDEK